MFIPVLMIIGAFALLDGPEEPKNENNVIDLKTKKKIKPKKEIKKVESEK